MSERDKARLNKFDEFVNFSNAQPHINNSHEFGKTIADRSTGLDLSILETMLMTQSATSKGRLNINRAF